MTYASGGMLLAELKESKDRQDDDDMEPEVFLILRFSYTHLKDSALQQDFEVDRNDLIGYLIGAGRI